MKKFEVTRKVVLSEEDLDNIVDAAVDFCSHWCDLLEYGKEPASKVTAMSGALSHGGTLVFHINEPFADDGETRFELTTEKLLKGLTECVNFDFEDYDGPMADAVLQQALFGEVVYG